MRFKLFGTEISVSFLFYAVIAIMIICDRSGLALPVLLACFLHEVSHLAAMRLSGVNPKKIKLIPAGALIICPFFTGKKNEAFIAASGPVSNLIAAGLFYAVYRFFGWEYAFLMCSVNAVTGIFNLMPLAGLDGGTLLILLLCRFGISRERAGAAVRIITVVFAAFLLFLCVFVLIGKNFNISLFILAVYLFICVFLSHDI